MTKKIALSLYLLSGMLLSNGATKVAIATPQPLPTTLHPIAQITTPAPASPNFKLPNFKLRVEDLSPEFQELPPELTASITSQFQLLSQKFAQAQLNPENLFAFVNPENFQIVVGFTSELSPDTNLAEFDNNLQQLQQPEIQQFLFSQLQERLQANGEIKVLDYKSLPELNNLADSSTGLSLGVDMEGQPMRFDLATFRRGKVLAFTAVMYINGQIPSIPIGDVARKLDARIVQISAQPNSSRLQVAKDFNRQEIIGNRESGIGNRESGIGNRESGIGNRE